MSKTLRAAANNARRSAVPKVAPPRPLQSQPHALDDSLYVDNETYNKRRRILWAGGIAVITAAGAILGAQVKTLTETNKAQEQDRPIASTKVESTSGNEIKPSSQQVGLNNNTIAQQIATLEATRASLRIQKEKLEGKISRIRARKQEKEAIEARSKMNINK